MLKLATSAIALLFAMIQSTNAQKIEKKDYSALGIYEFFLDQQHPEWLQQIRSSKIIPVFNVSGKITYKESIIKTNLLILEPDSELIFDAHDTKLWAIIADKVIINGPNIKIGRSSDRLAHIPEKSPNGAHGAHGHGHIGSTGASGGHGAVGTAGAKGTTVEIPPLIIATRRLEIKSGVDISTVSFNLNGVPGSIGGRGGDGGNGGNAVGGQSGSTSAVRCRRQPGNGGNGGNAGAGGPGGAGGDGGDGGDLIFVAEASVGEALAKAKIYNEGGEGGASGQSGAPGTPGVGGSRGSREGWCQDKKADGAGGAPAAPSVANGPVGTLGERGTELIVSVTDIGPLLR